MVRYISAIDFPLAEMHHIRKKGSMDKRVTIYDIAKELNLSASTVSRVLSSSQRRVNPGIQKLVEETAKKMNYYPNTLARNLKNDTNRSLGVVLPSIANPFYPSIVRGMEDEADLLHYSINICSCDRNEAKIDRYLEKSIENRVGGLIAIYLDTMPKGMENFLARGGRALVVGTKNQTYPGCGAIYFDKELESYLATKHLLELGHRKIALFLSTINNQIRIDKQNGYRKALQEYGIDDTDRFLYIHGISEAIEDHDSVPDCNTGIFCANQLVEDANGVTGIVCMNDLVALGCISVLKNRGFSIPGDYSVIGFDDTFFSNLIDPQLTTLKIDKYELGRQVVRILVGMMEGSEKEFCEEFSAKVNLVVRESTAVPRNMDSSKGRE
jgi:LacI family transcriptional regulator